MEITQPIREVGLIKAVRKDRKGFAIGDVWFSNPVPLGNDVVKGATVEVEFERNGRWNNIRSLKVVEQAKVEIIPANTYRKNEESTASKTASCIISYAKDLLVAGKITKEELTTTSIALTIAYKEVLKNLA